MLNSTEKDLSQDRMIEENAARIARNEEAIKRQTEALEKIRDHYYPPPKGWFNRTWKFCGKMLCVIVAYLGIAEAVDWLWNSRVSAEMAAEYAAIGQRLFFEEGNAVGAVSCYERAIELDEGESDYRIALMLMRGMSLSGELLGAERPLTEDERQRLDRMLADASVLQESDPDDPMPHVLMAQALLLKGDRSAAAAEIDRAVACDPENASVRVRACAIDFFAGRIEASRKHLAEAVRRNPELPLVDSWKGMHALAIDHDAAAAVEHFKTATKRCPRLALAHAMTGKALLAGANPDMQAARTCFARALKLDAKQVLATLGMADTYEREGRLRVACLWLDRAVDNDANSIAARVARARIRGKLDDWQSAVADLTGALAINRFRADLYRLRAEACEKTGDTARAKADRATAAELEKTCSTSCAIAGAVGLAAAGIDAYAQPDIYGEAVRQSMVAEATRILQSRIDAAWRSGGGEVVLGAGVHRLNPIRLRSGVRLRLARDARVYGNADCNAYVGALARDPVEPVSAADLHNASGEDLAKREQYALFYAFRAHDIEIIGEPGSFVNGVNCPDPLGEEGYRGPHMFWFACSTNITIRGVRVAESGDYAYRFVDSSGVLLDGVKAEGGHDGVHFDLSDHVRIVNSTFETGDDSVAGSGCTDVVVSNCVLNSACSPFRLGGRNVLIADCRVTGPAKHPHRWTLTRSEKLRGAPTSEVKGRRTVGAFFQGYTGDRAHRNFTPGNLVVRNVTVENAERFMLMVSGLPGALWQDGRGIPDITFENVKATGLALPAAVVAKDDSPLTVTLRNCSFAFRAHQSCAFFGKNVKVVDEGVRLEGADRLYEERPNVSYDDVPDFPSWQTESDAQRAEWKLPPLTPKAVIGLISDIHLRQTSLAEPPTFDTRSVENFRKVLRWFDRMKADGVVASGDLTQLGTIPELRKFAETWFSVFPGDRRSDGAHVERLFIFGDHDTETFCSFTDDYRNLFRQEGTLARHLEIDLALHDRARQWEAAFHEKFEPIRRRTVKGYDFVLAHLDHRDEPGMRHGDQLHIPGLEEFFATNRFDATKPFFYVQHKIPRGTVGGPTQSGQDDGRTSAILSRYPNAIAFCGHKHRTATEELSLWQGAFTTVQVPALISLLTAAGRENSSCSCEAACAHPPQQLKPVMQGVTGSHALLMKIYDDMIAIERVDVEHGFEPVAEPWLLRLPNAGAAAYSARGADAGVPQFAAGARATAQLIDGRDRTGKAVRQVEVRFPPAAATASAPRAYDYEIEARLSKGVVTRTLVCKRVYSPRLHFPPRLDTEDVVCRFGLEELSDNHDSISFIIRPLNAWGAAGKPLQTKPQAIDPAPPRYAF